MEMELTDRSAKCHPVFCGKCVVENGVARGIAVIAIAGNVEDNGEKGENSGGIFPHGVRLSRSRSHLIQVDAEKPLDMERKPAEEEHDNNRNWKGGRMEERVGVIQRDYLGTSTCSTH
jgi:hypothetical protein